MVNVIPSLSQSYTIKVSKLDSLIFYAKKGKFCDSLSETHLKAITALQISDSQKGKVIELQSSLIENYRILDANWSESLQNQADLFLIEKSKLRSQKRKWLRISIAEAGLIAVLLIALL